MKRGIRAMRRGLLGLTLAAILGTLGGVFAAVLTAISQQLPSAGGERLWLVSAYDVKAGLRELPLTPGEFLFLTERPGVRATAFSEGLRPATVGPQGERPRVLNAAAVYENFFEVFPATRGRGAGFETGASWYGSTPTAVVSESIAASLRLRDMSTEPPLVVDGTTMRVRGTADVDWGIGPKPQIWLPLRWARQATDSVMFRRARFLRVVARTGSKLEDQTLRQAVRELQSHHKNEVGEEIRYEPIPFRGWLLAGLKEPLALATFAVLSLIAGCCGAVGLHQLATVEGRRQEFTVRFAIGATVRQLVVRSWWEGMASLLMGCVLGFMIAAATATVLLKPPPGITDRQSELAAVAASAALLALLLAVVSLLASANAATWRWAQVRRRLFQRSLLAAQIGVGIATLAAALAVGEKLNQSAQLKLGFEPSHVTYAPVVLPIAKFLNTELMVDFYWALEGELSGQAWAEGVAFVDRVPTDGMSWTGEALLKDGESAGPDFSHRVVLGNYPRAMGLRVLAGSWFTGRPEGLVVVINATAARSYFGSVSRSIGQQLGFSGEGDNEVRRYEVVGVVEDQRLGALPGTVMPEVFEPYWQDPKWSMFAVLKVRPGTGRAAVKTLTNSATTLGRGDVAVGESRWLKQDVQALRRREYLLLLLLGFVAVASLLLVFLSVQGAVRVALQRRLLEAGIRLAVGASPRRLAVELSRSLLGVGLCGSAAGLLALGMADSMAPVELVRPWAAVAGVLGVWVVTAGATWRGSEVVATSEPARLLASRE